MLLNILSFLISKNAINSDLFLAIVQYLLLKKFHMTTLVWFFLHLYTFKINYKLLKWKIKLLHCFISKKITILNKIESSLFLKLLIKQFFFNQKNLNFYFQNQTKLTAVGCSFQGWVSGAGRSHVWGIPGYLQGRRGHPASAVVHHGKWQWGEVRVVSADVWCGHCHWRGSVIVKGWHF